MAVKYKIKLFKTEDFSFVILICHDSEFPQLSTKLLELKPQVIFVPSQTDGEFGRERVRATSRARAIDIDKLNSARNDKSQVYLQRDAL